MRSISIGACVLSLILVGCNSESTTTEEAVPELNDLSVSTSPLKSQSISTFERHLKQGVYLQHHYGSTMHLLESELAADSGTSTSFSRTNVQEAGVDEGDRVKYDGNILYIASNQLDYAYITSDNQATDFKAKVRVLQKADEGKLNHLTDISISTPENEISQLYLTNKTLGVISHQQLFNIEPVRTRFFATDSQFTLEAHNVTSPSNPQMNYALTVDGRVIDTRRVNNTLYVVSSFSPSVEELIEGDSSQVKLQNYQTIMAKPLESLLPTYTDAQGNEKVLIAEENCYLPASVTSKDGFDGIVTLSAFDLVSGEVLHSTCVNTQIDGIYATPNSIYLYGTEYVNGAADNEEKSVIHKFSVEEQAIEYQATGTLKGRFNWHMSNLRFSEQNGYLRVVTTSGDGVQGFTHKLNVLSQQQDKLAILSELPSSDDSFTIGKRNQEGIVDEDIKAVRFFQDRAFIVTYRTVDPLYVIDLSDPASPMIAGELEIPGYSAYLHPLNENSLIGVGQQVDPNRFNDSDEPSSGDETPIVEGAKVSLFDINNIAAPQEISSIIFERGYTPVEFDYHAFTLLKTSDENYRLALPIERWGVFDDGVGQQSTSLFWQQENYLALIEISNAQSNVTMSQVGSIFAIDENADKDPNMRYVTGWQDRSVIDEDDVYYIHGDRVWYGAWGSWIDSGTAY